MTSYLFVYGTLRRASGHPMARFLAERARFVGEAKTRGKLYELGRYPGLVAAEDGSVKGDVFELLDTETLWELDRYENGDSPRFVDFDRQEADATLASGETIRAWVYWYRGAVREEQRIVSGDYSVERL